jgi:hypothetical protein
LERSRIWRESSLQKAAPAPELLEELRLGTLIRLWGVVPPDERVLRGWPLEKVSWSSSSSRYLLVACWEEDRSWRQRKRHARGRGDQPCNIFHVS